MQLDLNKDYTALGKLTVGTSEYKAARNAYYAKRDKVLGSLKGGKLLTGGIADRLAAVPFVMEAQVTSMGTGVGAEQQERAYRNFIKARDRVLSGDDPDSYKLKLAWDKLILGRQYAPKQDEEIHRVAAWAYLLAEAKHQRYLARTHYSEYYEAQGESAASKYGTARADELNTAIKRLRTFSPAFSRQLDDWFGTDANIGYQFIDWYSR